MSVQLNVKVDEKTAEGIKKLAAVAHFRIQFALLKFSLWESAFFRQLFYY